MFLVGCSQSKHAQSFGMDNLYAWCIVPFDSKERSPQERIEMLSSLGFNKYAYDWRQKHLDEMASEWTLAKNKNIEVMAVWMWLDNAQDSIGRLSTSNEKVLSAIQETDLQTQLWVSFNSNFFAELGHNEAVAKGAEMIEYLCQRAESLNISIGLYNHGDWFGEPENQIDIIKALPNRKLGLIYNFHHAHHQLETYDETAELMVPFLWAVNLNGMRKNGPKILTIGQRNLEKQMIDVLLEKGYKGPFGILGHIEDADVELILKNNLKGLSNL